MDVFIDTILPLILVTGWLASGVVAARITYRRHCAKRRTDVAYGMVCTDASCAVQDTILVPLGALALLLVLTTDYFTP
jgi:hypothetical protein